MSDSTTYPKTAPNDASPVAASYDLVTGRGGTGKALRSIVTGGGGEESVSWLSPWHAGYQFGNANMTGAGWGAYGTGDTLIAQVYFRGNTGGSIGTAGNKWFELWDTGNLRVQITKRDGANSWVMGSGNYGSGSGWPSIRPGQQPIGPYPNSLFDDAWHHMTILLKPNTTATDDGSGVAYGSVQASSRDGRCAVWVDGTKIIDVSQATVGITPTGGTHPWCTQTDVDTIPSIKRTYVIFPNVFNATPAALTLDHDDLKFWVP
jgi:hypothetical protein